MEDWPEYKQVYANTTALVIEYTDGTTTVERKEYSRETHRAMGDKWRAALDRDDVVVAYVMLGIVAVHGRTANEIRSDEWHS